MGPITPNLKMLNTDTYNYKQRRKYKKCVGSRFSRSIGNESGGRLKRKKKNYTRISNISYVSLQQIVNS